VSLAARLDLNSERITVQLERAYGNKQNCASGVGMWFIVCQDLDTCILQLALDVSLKLDNREAILFGVWISCQDLYVEGGEAGQRIPIVSHLSAQRRSGKY